MSLSDAVLILSSLLVCLATVTVLTISDLRQERKRTARLFRERLDLHDKNMTLAADKVKLTGEVQSLSRLLFDK